MRKNFNIPLLPYLKKYVEKQFFSGLKAPYKIEEDTLLGKQFMSLILDARKKDMRGDKKIEMTATLQIYLSEAFAKRSPSLPKLVPINFYLDKLFKHDLINWVQMGEEVGIRPFNSCKYFLAFYKIDESEYSHDAAYRYYNRQRQQGYRSPKKAGEQRNKIRAAMTEALEGEKISRFEDQK